MWTHEILNVARACVEEGDTRDLHEHKDDEDDEDEDEEEEEEEEAEGKTAKHDKLPYDDDAVPAVFDQLKPALEMRSDPAPSERTAKKELEGGYAPGESKQGLSRIFRDANRNPTPVSDGETHAHRDQRLFALLPHELALMSDVCQMSEADGTVRRRSRPRSRGFIGLNG